MFEHIYKYCNFHEMLVYRYEIDRVFLILPVMFQPILRNQ